MGRDKNFDDELPDWLKGDDDSPQQDADDFPAWESDAGKSGDSTTPSSLGVTGTLPWRQGVSDTSSGSRPGLTSHLDGIDWTSLESSAADTGSGFDTADASTSSQASTNANLPDWLAGSTDFEDDTSFNPNIANNSLTPADDFADWLDTGDDAADSHPSIPPASGSSSAGLPDWLSDEPSFEDELAFSSPQNDRWDNDSADSNTDFDFDDAFSNSDSSFTETSEPAIKGIRRIAPRETPPTASEPPVSKPPTIKKLGKSSSKAAPKAADELTFNEWEQLQQQEAYEEEHAEELAMEAEVPDWFVDNVEMGDAASEIASILMGEPEEEEAIDLPSVGTGNLDNNFTPDWFLGLEEQNLEDAPEWIREATTSTVDVDSLLDVSAFAPATPVIEEALPEPVSDEVPDWFQGLGGELSAEEASWMSAFDAPSEASNVSTSTTPPEFETPDDDAPDWLQGFEAPQATSPTPAPKAIEPPANTGLDWLEDIGGADFSSELEEPVSAFGSPTQAPRPQANLQDIKPTPGIDDLLSLYDAGTSSGVVKSGRDPLLNTNMADDAFDDLFSDVNPDLLSALDQHSVAAAQKKEAGVVEDLPPAMMTEGQAIVEVLRPDEQVKLRAGSLEIEYEQQGLAYLPDDLLDLREKSLNFIQNKPTSSSTPPASGPLAGISGSLEYQEKVLNAEQLELSTQLNVPEAQIGRIELLAAALESEDEFDEPELEEQPRRIRRRRQSSRQFDRFVVSIILLAALIAPFITDKLHLATDPDNQSFDARQQNLISAVAGLNAGDRVLLAFEYGPTAAGELNELAEAVLRDILRQRAVPITISTNSLGALNARHILDELGDDEALLNALERDEALVSGRDYFTLRYVSGGAVAIRALSQNNVLSNLIFSTDSTGQKTGLEIGEIDAHDFAMVLIVGENLDDVRNWAEQFDVEGLPKYALVTAGAEPFVHAYVDTDDGLGYRGYLAGYRDTYRYNLVRNAAIRAPIEIPDDVNIPDPELAQWHSLAFGALVASLLVLLGMVFNTLRGIRRRDA